LIVITLYIIGLVLSTFQ